MAEGKAPTTDREPISADDVRHLVGDIERLRIAEVLETGATIQDIEIALAWAAGESDVMGEERLPLAGRAAQVYEIIFGDTDYPEEP